MTHHLDLPPLDVHPLPPRPGEWDRVRARGRRRRYARTAAVSTAVVLAAGVPLGTTALVLDGGEDRVRPPQVAQGPAAVRVHDGPPLSREHVSGDVSYPDEQLRPPLGGAHAPAPQTCGIYAAPVPDENAVHSLEHGAVWITYRPDLDRSEVARLRDTIAGAAAYGLLSPRVQQAPVVATAWERQLEVDTADDPRLAQFVEAYAQGPQTPERGARCDGETGMQFTSRAAPAAVPPCSGSTTGFDILTDGRPDGPTPEQAATAYATRRGNGAGAQLPPDGWELLVQTADRATVVSGPASLSLFRASGAWAVDGGARCSDG